VAARRRNAGQRKGRQAGRTHPRSGWIGTTLIGAVVGLFLLSIAWQFRPQPAQEIPPPPTPVKVVVLNGCGKTGLAAVFKEKLLRVANGTVDVVGTKNAPVMDVPRTLVASHSDSLAAARHVGRLIGCDSTSVRLPTDGGIEVTVILGYDFDTLFPGQDRWWETP